MATYDPPDDLLARQLDSIRSQSHENWVCVITDDCSRPERYQALQEAIGGDERFVLSRSERRLGFYGNFERALELVPRDAEYVAIADQDDDWRPGKLAALLDGLGDALLVYSDARVVSRDGELISETWWNRRHNNHDDLLSLLVANSVTGAASLLRRELLDTALPFPPRQFHHFHDHWIGLVALSLDGIAYVPEPLYDYVQHGAAVARARARQPDGVAARAPRPPAPAARARAYVATALLRRHLAAAAVLRGAADAGGRRDRDPRSAACSSGSWTATDLSLAARLARGARRPRARIEDAGDARRRVGAVPRARVATAARADRA